MHIELEKVCKEDKEKQALEAVLSSTIFQEKVELVLDKLIEQARKELPLADYSVPHWDKVVADKYGQLRAYRKIKSILQIKE